MRKVIFVLLCLLFVLTMLFPVGALVSAFFGYTFELTSVLAVSAVIAVISVFTVISGIISKDTSSITFLRSLFPYINQRDIRIFQHIPEFIIEEY